MLQWKNFAYGSRRGVTIREGGRRSLRARLSAIVLLGCGSAQIKNQSRRRFDGPACGTFGGSAAGGRGGGSGAVKREAARRARRCGRRRNQDGRGRRRSWWLGRRRGYSRGRRPGAAALRTAAAQPAIRRRGWRGRNIPSHLLARLRQRSRVRRDEMPPQRRARVHTRHPVASNACTLSPSRRGSATVMGPERLRTFAARQRLSATPLKVVTVATTTPPSTRAQTFVRRLAAATA